MLQLACAEPIFTSRCYKVIIAVFDLCNEDVKRDEIISILKSKNDFINSTYCDSLLQIWHYYVLSKYDYRTSIRELIGSFGNDEINPIILAGFVKNEKSGNKELFNYIKNTYSSIVNKNGEHSYWMRSIMFSKWWLPLLVIYLKDGKNYSEFYESKHFHTIYKQMKEDRY